MTARSYEIIVKKMYHILTLIITLGLLLKPVPVLAISLNDYFSLSYDVDFSTASVNAEQEFTIKVTGTAVCKKDLESPLNLVSEVRTSAQVVAKNQSDESELVLYPEYRLNIKPAPTKAGESATDSQTLTLSFPAGTPTGVYEISGKVIRAQAKAVIWLDITEYLPPIIAMGKIGVEPVGMSTLTTDPSGTTVPVVSVPQIELGELTVDPENQTTGRGITAKIRVSNSGETENTYEAVLRVNDIEVSRQEVFLGAGENQELVFTFSINSPGEYIISVGERMATLTVQPTTPVVSQTTPQTSDSPIPAQGNRIWLWIVLLAVGISGALIVVIILRRR